MKNLPKAIFGLGIILGLYGFTTFLKAGHAGLGYTSYAPWGLWVVLYTSLVGVSVGSFLIVFLAFGLGMNVLKPAARLVPAVSLVSLLCGLLFIVLDLGRWERVFNLLFSLNPSSPMAYLGWLYLLYTILLLYLLLTLKNGREENLDKLALAGMVISFFIALGEGSLFSVLRARPYWNGGLTLLRYLADAYLAGTALTLLVATYWANLAEGKRFLARLVLSLLGVAFLLELIDLGIAFASGNGNELEPYLMVLAGSEAWLFWLIQIGLGVLLAGFLLWGQLKADQSNPLRAGAIVVLAGYLATKYNLLVPGLRATLLPGLVQAFSHPKLVADYRPTSTEVLIVIGLLSLAGLAITYLTEFLTITTTKNEVKGRVGA